MNHIVLVDAIKHGIVYRRSIQIYLDKPADTHQFLIYVTCTMRDGWAKPILDDQRLDLKEKYPELYAEAKAEVDKWLDINPAWWLSKARFEDHTIRTTN